MVVVVEAGAGTVEVVARAAVVQQAGEEGALVQDTGPSSAPPAPSAHFCSTCSRDKAGPSLTLGAFLLWFL